MNADIGACGSRICVQMVWRPGCLAGDLVSQNGLGTIRSQSLERLKYTAGQLFVLSTLLLS